MSVEDDEPSGRPEESVMDENVRNIPQNNLGLPQNEVDWDLTLQNYQRNVLAISFMNIRVR